MIRAIVFDLGGVLIDLDFDNVSAPSGRYSVMSGLRKSWT